MSRVVYKTGVAIYKHLPEPLQEIIWTKVKSRKVEDRRYLEDVILPKLCAMRPRRVLFVGVRLYTRHYADAFERAGAEFWTLEILPRLAKYGSRDHHVVGSVVDSDALFEPQFFDAVILNGVLGWGVDRVEDQEKTLEALWKVLKPGGTLVLGYNSDRVKDPLGMRSIQAHYDHGIPDLPPRVTFETASHVYDFFRARGHEAAA